MESTEILELAQDQIGSQTQLLTDMIPTLVISLVVSLVVLFTVSIVALRQRHKQHKAILQTAEDTKAIRKLLERQIELRIQPQPRPVELQSDPQLPAQP